LPAKLLILDTVRGQARSCNSVYEYDKTPVRNPYRYCSSPYCLSFLRRVTRVIPSNSAAWD